MAGERVDVRLRDGRRGSVPADKLAEYVRDYGVEQLSPEELRQDEAKKQLEEDYGGVGGTAMAAATGLAGGITWGGSDLVQSIPRIQALLQGESPLNDEVVERNAREQRKYVAANTVTETVGQLAGGLATGGIVEDAAKFAIGKAALPLARGLEGISPSLSAKLLRSVAATGDAASMAPTVGKAITPRVATAAKIVGKEAGAADSFVSSLPIDTETGLPSLLPEPGMGGGTASMKTLQTSEKAGQWKAFSGSKWNELRDERMIADYDPNFARGTSAEQSSDLVVEEMRKKALKAQGMWPGESKVAGAAGDEVTGVTRPFGGVTGGGVAKATEGVEAKALEGQAQSAYRGALPDLSHPADEVASTRTLRDVLPDEAITKYAVEQRLNSQAFKTFQKLATTATAGAVQGAGTAVSDDMLGPDHHVQASHLVYGAALGAGVGILADIGLGHLPKAAKSVAETGVQAAMSEPIGTHFAKFLRDAEAGHGIAAVTKGGRGVTQTAIEDAGGAAGFWDAVKKDYIGDMKLSDKVSFGNPEFVARVDTKLAGYAAIEQDALKAVSKVAEERGQLPFASDVLAPFDEAIQRLSSRIGREGDAQTLLGIKNEVMQKRLGLTPGGQFATQAAMGQPVQLGAASEIATDLNGLLQKHHAAPGSVGEELVSIRRKVDELINKQAGAALGDDGKKLAKEFVDIRKRVMAGRGLKDAISKAEGGAADAAGTSEFARSLMNAGIWSVATGHPGIMAMSLLGSAVKYVMRQHGDIMAAELLSKAAQLAGVDAGAKAAEMEMRDGLKQAIGGTAKAAEKGLAFDADATKEAITRFQQITPEENARRTLAYAQLVGDDAPKVATALAVMASKAMGYLVETAPQPLPIPRAIGQKPVFAIDDLRRWHDEKLVIDHPPTFTSKLNDLTLTKAQAQAVKNTNPVLFATSQDVLLQMLHDSANNIPYERRFKLGWLLDVPTDPTLNIELQLTMQKSIEDVQAMQDEESQNSGPPPIRNVKIDKASSLVSPSDKLGMETP